jgi:hypothetical protein
MSKSGGGGLLDGGTLPPGTLGLTCISPRLFTHSHLQKLRTRIALRTTPAYRVRDIQP